MPVKKCLLHLFKIVKLSAHSDEEELKTQTLVECCLCISSVEQLKNHIQLKSHIFKGF